MFVRPPVRPSARSSARPFVRPPVRPPARSSARPPRPCPLRHRPAGPIRRRRRTAGCRGDRRLGGRRPGGPAERRRRGAGRGSMSGRRPPRARSGRWTRRPAGRRCWATAGGRAGSTAALSARISAGSNRIARRPSGWTCAPRPPATSGRATPRAGTSGRGGGRAGAEGQRPAARARAPHALL